jgi:hypothetical protein
MYVIIDYGWLGGGGSTLRALNETIDTVGEGLSDLAHRLLERPTESCRAGGDCIPILIGEGPDVALARGYNTFKALKKGVGVALNGFNWHHLVEQRASNLARFGAQAIHNVENVIHLPVDVHRRVSALYSSKNLAITGDSTVTVRQWIGQKSYAEQLSFGWLALQNVLNGIW